MSQVVDRPEQPALREAANEFSYKPMPAMAPAAAAVGVLSLVCLISPLMLVIPFLGLLLGSVALLQIRGSRGEYGGRVIATAGATLSFFLLVGGSAWHAYQYHTEVPEGFQRVSFVSEISQKGFVTEDGVTRVHPYVQSLDGLKMFTKGYMYPTRQTKNLDRFVLCKDSGQCCFGGNPKLTDMILVELPKNETVDYRAGLVAVAGTFRTSNTLDEAGLNPVFKLEGKFVGPAKTAY